MDCGITREQLWSWIDRDAPELAAHLEICPACRARAEEIRERIRLVTAGAAPSAPLPGKIGPYAIRRLIGEGGQALVYEAEQPAPRRRVALKVFRGGCRADPALRRQFRRESQALAQLKHPGIATIYEAGVTDEGLHWFAMELVHGTPLADHLRETGRPRRENLELFRRICRAVHHAHRRGVIHRDLKPSNILVESDGNPKILDFGLSRVRRGDAVPTLTAAAGQAVEGTPRYMSPEQARGRPGDIDERTDVYSLGVMLYEMLVGRPPHDIASLSPDALRVLCEEPPPRPRRLDPALDGDLETIVLKALEKDPARRYRSAEALAEDLRRHLDREPIRARPPGVLRRLGRFARRRAAVLGAAAVLLAIALQAGGFLDRPRYDVEVARLDVLGMCCALLGDGWDTALHARALEAMDRYPGLTEAVLLRAQALTIDRSPHLAIDLLAGELRRDPSLWPYRSMLDEVRLSIEGPDGAGAGGGDGTAASGEVGGDGAGAWYLRSCATLDLEEARSRARQAVARDPRHGPALAALALLARAAGDDEDALAWASRLVEAGPDPYRWSRFRFDLLREARRHAEAALESARMVSLRPRSATAHLVHARILRRLRRYPEAVASFDRAIELAGPAAPSSAWRYYHRGTLNWMLGRRDGAVADYRQARRLLRYPTYADVRLHFILHEMGSAAEADSALARARRRVWNDPWLARILDALAGDVAPDRLVAAAAGPRQLCEACYYAGEIVLLAGRTEEARGWFRRCLDTGLVDDPDEPLEPMSEHELAAWRLGGLEVQPQHAAEAAAGPPLRTLE